VRKKQNQKEVRRIEIGRIKMNPSSGEKNMDKEEAQRNHS